MNPAGALSNIPAGLREELINEYRSIIQNYAEHRWSPSELSGGLFCEIVYTLLDGHAKGTYPNRASKPRDFVTACRQLETHTHVPRSFQILIPRILPALYEVRNNRGVGHVGGDVDPNHMDATLVVSMCNWIMAELVRVFHQLPIIDAQKLVDAICERRMPLIWHGANMKRVLDPEMRLQDQILILAAVSPSKVLTTDLQNWTGYKNKPYFLKLLRQMHGRRLLELSGDQTEIEILPPGSTLASQIASKYLK